MIAFAAFFTEFGKNSSFLSKFLYFSNELSTVHMTPSDIFVRKSRPNSNWHSGNPVSMKCQLISLQRFGNSYSAT